MWSSPGAHFINVILPAIQIWWKIPLAIIPLLATRLQKKICTSHVMPCTKFCSDHFNRTKVRVKWNFHRIWIAMENLLVNQASGPAFVRPDESIIFDHILYFSSWALVKLLSGECHRTPLMISNFGSGNGVVPSGKKPLREPVLT